MSSEIIKKMINGDKYALAKVITQVELGQQYLQEVMKAAYENRSEPHVIGVTGPPGAGKSTLINAVVTKLADAGKKVAVIAIDPNSPFSGGAILGDRVRMNKLNLRENVFIRSISNRNNLGGLSISTYQIVKVFEACRYDYVFVETVGIGQSEVSIMNIVDTVVLTLAPGLGDDIQAFKAGVLEIGNLFVINKSDRDGASKLANEMKDITTDISKDWWQVPILQTDSLNETGIDELLAQIKTHKIKLRENTDFNAIKRNRIKLQMMNLFEKKFSTLMKQTIEEKGNLDEVLGDVLQGEASVSNIVDYNIYSILDKSDKYLCQY